ncbi:DNA translocase FtsK 4TM domain-containing protein [Pendulispora albinea]|uniref:DNA translocase FtsK n=1 Tax=Pendulispora albinea TaxID=2741071 RepID=A0ABZ2LYR6_9BACT
MALPLFAPRRAVTHPASALPENTRAPSFLGAGAVLQPRNREVAALLLWTTAVFLTLALSSYEHDPATGQGTGADWVGPVGESCARALVSLIGVIAWAVPLETVLLGIPFVRGRRSAITLARLAGDLLIALTAAAMVQVGWPGQLAFGHHLAGGWVGELFGELSRSLFSTIGSFLVGFAFLGLILIGRASFSFIALMRWLARFGERSARGTASGARSVAEAWQTARQIEREKTEKARLAELPRIGAPAEGPATIAVLPDEADDDGFDAVPESGDAPDVDMGDVLAPSDAPKRRTRKPRAAAGANAAGANAGTGGAGANASGADGAGANASGADSADGGNSAPAPQPRRGRGAASASAEAKSADGKSEGKAGDGKSTDGKSTDGKSTDGKTTDAKASTKSADGRTPDRSDPVDLEEPEGASEPEPKAGRRRRGAAGGAQGKDAAPVESSGPTIIDTSAALAKELATPEPPPETLASAPPPASEAHGTSGAAAHGTPSTPSTPSTSSAAGHGAPSAPSAATAHSAPGAARPKDGTPTVAAPPPAPVKAGKDKLVPAFADGFRLPSIDFLIPSKEDPNLTIDHETLLKNAELLVKTLGDYGVSGKVEDILPGPTVTTFEVSPAAGTKVSKVASLADDLALALARKVRIVAPIPGKNRIGFELPNERRLPVNLRDLVEDRRFQTLDAPLPVVLGRDILGSPVYADLASMPHVIVAGATGAGKSVGLNVMLSSLLYRRTPDELRLLMIDPKVVELAPFDRIPHMLLPVVTDMKQAANALKWAVDEMERRYQLFADAGTKNIGTFNGWVERVHRGEAKNPAPKVVMAKDHNGLPEAINPDFTSGEQGEAPLPEKLPLIVIVVDEFADLMMQQGKEVEAAVARLAQKARAAGMHVILATQRPSVDVITGMIKANFPTRVAFRVAQKVDSRTILDEQGAEHLLGRGDMLIKLNGTNETKRVQCPMITEEEVQAITDFLRLQGEPVYDENILKPRDEDDAADAEQDAEQDAMYDDAVRLVADTRRCSTSWLQRKLGLGYNRAARIVEMMERRGLVGPANGAKDREVLISSL